MITPNRAWVDAEDAPASVRGCALERLLDFSESGETTSGHYVPTELVQTINDFLVIGWISTTS